jgi:drug/metabolite transporter (DMT)-like permease
LPFVLPEISKWPRLVAMSPSILENLIFLGGVFYSVLEYLCYVYSIKRLIPTVSLTFLNLIPVITVISSWF